MFYIHTIRSSLCQARSKIQSWLNKCRNELLPGKKILEFENAAA